MADDTGLRVSVNADPVLRKLRTGADPARVNAAMRDAMHASVLEVHRRVTAKLSGPVLKVNEDFLRGQMQFQVSPDGRVGIVGTNVVYAKIHEFGGTTPPHTIEVHDFDSALPISVVASNVRSRGAAGVIFRAKVNHPGSVIPERPYMRPSLAESMDVIKGNFAAAVRGLMVQT